MTRLRRNRERKEISGLICHGQTVLDPKRWLDEEASFLATTIPNLDEISSQAIRPLAKLVEVGTADATRLSNALGIDLDTIGEYLNQLCEFEFVEQHRTEYKATTSGQQVFNAIGDQMIRRQAYELKRQLDAVESLR